MNLILWLPIINVIGFIFLGIGTFYMQFRAGGKGVSSEVISTYREQVAQLKEEIAAEGAGREADKHSLKNEIQVLSLKLATLQGQMIEKDKKIAELTNIFQGRDPELLKILTEIRDFMKTLTNQSSTIAVRSKTNEVRNELIDSNTAQDKGHVMRGKGKAK